MDGKVGSRKGLTSEDIVFTVGNKRTRPFTTKFKVWWFPNSLCVLFLFELDFNTTLYVSLTFSILLFNMVKPVRLCPW